MGLSPPPGFLDPWGLIRARCEWGKGLLSPGPPRGSTAACLVTEFTTAMPLWPSPPPAIVSGAELEYTVGSALLFLCCSQTHFHIFLKTVLTTSSILEAASFGGKQGPGSSVGENSCTSQNTRSASVIHPKIKTWGELW